MPFGGESSAKLVISMMAAVNIGELRDLVGVPHSQVVRTVREVYEKRTKSLYCCCHIPYLVVH